MLGVQANVLSIIKHTKRQVFTSFRFKLHHWVRFINLAGLLALASCMQFRTNPKGIQNEFAYSGVTPHIIDTLVGERTIRFVEVGRRQALKPTLFFVHGAPGSSDNFFQFMKDARLAELFTMVSVDRPGYGYSGFGQSETSITRQAQSLAPVLARYCQTPTLVIGHSYGGPVAAKLAVLYPQHVSGLMLLAPAIDPANEKKISIAWLGKTPPFRWLTPKSWKVATDEKYSHVQELTNMLPDWQKIKVPVTYIQGTSDRLVPFANLAFARQHIDSCYLKTISLPGEDHFLPWSQQELITQEILLLNQQVKPPLHILACQPKE